MTFQQREMTAEEFLAYEARHDDILFNFADGKPVAVMATGRRGRIAARSCQPLVTICE
ncbi:MAG: hypothetical protein H0X30_15975 [Anaerolineae bacterium]|nr:hypothetical protein [Anaerolineae bacterium]